MIGDFTASVEKAMVNAQARAMQRLIDNDLKPIIKEEAYSYVSKAKEPFYDRTYQLLDDWVVDRKGNEVTIRRSKYGLIRNPEKFQHSSILGNLSEDEYLEMMNGEWNDEIYKPPFNFPPASEIDRGSFWNEFKKVFNKKFKQYYEEECAKVGLKGKLASQAWQILREGD